MILFGHFFRRSSVACFILIVLSVGSCCAAGLYEDPLLATPPELSSISTFPGDAGPSACMDIDENEPLTLVNAVDITLCRNARIKSAWVDIKIKAGALGETKAAYLPNISGTLSKLRTRTGFSDFNVSETDRTGRTVYGSFNWQLFDFGGRAANRKAAALLLQAALLSHDATIQRIMTALIQAYFSVQTAQGILAAREDSLRIAQSTLAAVQRREKRGLVSRSDTLQAAAAYAKAELANNRAKGDLEKALSMLRYTMGISPDSHIIFAKSGDEVGETSPRQLTEWLAMVGQNHPAIISARTRWQAAEERITAVRSEIRPRLDFAANYYQNGYPNQGLQSISTNTHTIGLTLTIPIFDGFAHRYKIYGAQATAEQKEQDLRDTQSQVLMEVVKAYADTQSSFHNLKASENLLVAARDALGSSRRRYERGATDIIELLNAQSTYDDAEQERVRCLSEWRSARLILFSASGVLSHADLRTEFHTHFNH